MSYEEFSSHNKIHCILIRITCFIHPTYPRTPLAGLERVDKYECVTELCRVQVYVLCMVQLVQWASWLFTSNIFLLKF